MKKVHRMFFSALRERSNSDWMFQSVRFANIYIFFGISMKLTFLMQATRSDRKHRKLGLLWIRDSWPIVLGGFLWRSALGAPREPKLVKRVISSSFCYCHFKDDLRLRSHREKFNIDILAQNFFRSQYTCGEARKKIWDKKSMLNFSRQAHNAKVTDCHALFRILWFFESGCFLGRNACYELCMLIANRMHCTACTVSTINSVV